MNYSEAKLGNLYTEEVTISFQKLEFKNLLSRFDVSAPEPTRSRTDLRSLLGNQKRRKVFVQAEEAEVPLGAVIFKDLENVLPLFVCRSRPDLELSDCVLFKRRKGVIVSKLKRHNRRMVTEKTCGDVAEEGRNVCNVPFKRVYGTGK